MTIIGWFIAVLCLLLVAAMVWLDHKSAKRHKKWMDDFSRRTKAKLGEDWEEEFDSEE